MFGFRFVTITSIHVEYSGVAIGLCFDFILDQLCPLPRKTGSRTNKMPLVPNRRPLLHPMPITESPGTTKHAALNEKLVF